MKAILMFNMPKQCNECPCYDHEGGICQATSNWKADRKDGCPLRPIPTDACKTLIAGLDAWEGMRSVEVNYVRRTE